MHRRSRRGRNYDCAGAHWSFCSGLSAGKWRVGTGLQDAVSLQGPECRTAVPTVTSVPLSLLRWIDQQLDGLVPAAESLMTSKGETGFHIAAGLSTSRIWDPYYERAQQICHSDLTPMNLMIEKTSFASVLFFRADIC